MSDVMKNIDNLMDLINQSLKEAAEDVGEYVEQKAKDNLIKNGSYRTGNLHNSIDSRTEEQGDDTIAKIGTKVDYAHYLELGTSKMRAKPYMAPALEDNTQEIIKIVADNLRKGLK